MRSAPKGGVRHPTTCMDLGDFVSCGTSTERRMPRPSLMWKPQKLICAGEGSTVFPEAGEGLGGLVGGWETLPWL